MDTSKFLKEARDKLNLSQKQLGEKMGISRAIVNNYEINRTRMPASIYLKVQKLLKNNQTTN